MIDKKKVQARLARNLGIVIAAPKEGHVETREGKVLDSMKLPKGSWCYYVSKNGTKYAIHNVNGRLRAFKVPSQQEVALLPDMKSKVSAA